MKCLSCDVVLTDFEATRKYAGSGVFVDLCNRCFDVKEQPPVVERYDLMTEELVEQQTMEFEEYDSEE